MAARPMQSPNRAWRPWPADSMSDTDSGWPDAQWSDAKWDGWLLMHSDAMAARDIADAIMPVMECAFDPAFGEAWTLAQVHSALCMPTCQAVLVQQPDGRIAGFAMTRTVLDEQELLLIAVAPWARRRGIGQLLIETLKDRAFQLGVKSIFLEMRDGNPAEALYRSCNFVNIGQRPNYYTGADGARFDALTFQLTL